MENKDLEQWGIPTSFYKVNGDIWFSSRHIKNINNEEEFTLPWSSFIWNNFFFICKGIKELLKILLGASVLVALIKNGILEYIFK